MPEADDFEEQYHARAPKKDTFPPMEKLELPDLPPEHVDAVEKTRTEYRAICVEVRGYRPVEAPGVESTPENPGPITPREGYPELLADAVREYIAAMRPLLRQTETGEWLLEEALLATTPSGDRLEGVNDYCELESPPAQVSHNITRWVGNYYSLAIHSPDSDIFGGG